jgi:valyl-tRNA synthetase
MQELQDDGYLVKTENYETSVPHCERCNTRIEPLVSKQRFVDVQEYADQSINAVKK